MSKFVLVLLGLLAFFGTTPALAQGNAGSGSIKVDRNSLDHVKWHQGRREYQIIDTTPDIVDTRPPIQQPANVQINVGPRQVIPGAQYTYGDPASGGSGAAVPLTPRTTDLPQAGFGGSNISQHHMYTGLPGGQSVPITGREPAGAPTGSKALSGTLNPVPKKIAGQNPTTVSAYKDYKSQNGGNNSAGLKVQADATGKVMGVPPVPAAPKKHPLINRL